MKRACGRCNIEKDIKKFKIDKRRIDGRTVTCRQCYSENKLEKFIRTPEQIESQRQKLLGRKYSVKHRLAISEGHKRAVAENRHPFKKGDRPHKEADRKCLKYELWRQEVFLIKGRKCETCSAEDRLHVHHIKGFHNFPELRFDTNNGQILCISCHMKLHNAKSRCVNEGVN